MSKTYPKPVRACYNFDVLQRGTPVNLNQIPNRPGKGGILMSVIALVILIVVLILLFFVATPLIIVLCVVSAARRRRREQERIVDVVAKTVDDLTDETTPE